MRVVPWPRLTSGFFLLLLAGAGATAQFPGGRAAPPAGTDPDPDKVVADGLSAERAKLQAELGALLKRINTLPAPGTPPKNPPPSPKKIDLDASRPIDSLRLAMNLFRDGDTDAALRAFRLIDPGQLTREDRAFVRYMTACCLRKLGKVSDAAVVYREVADSQEDEFLAGCAVGQLSLMRSTQELEAQLEQLRAKPKSR